MAKFYPLNTPLINYYFYKAPFVQNGFSLIDYQIQNGGTNYSVGDIIIFSGGTFTSPFCAKVATVSSGVVQTLTITNAGVYITTPTPTTLTQGFTSGLGSGLILDNLAFDSNYLTPPGPNIPLTGGYIFFYEDENRTVKANTYSDVFDDQNPTVNPNPIQLGTSGDYPPIYLDDRFYYIVITDNTADQSNPVEVIEHYKPSQIISITSAFNDNFIINPQFNYGIKFYKETDQVGEITKPLTSFAWAWEFLEDEDTLSENIITLDPVSGEGIEGSPEFEATLSSDDVSSSETLKDMRTYLGAVDFYEGGNLTFSAQMRSQNGSSLNLIVYLEKNYGMNGSETEIIRLKTLTIGVTREKYTFSFEMPDNVGKTIGEGNYTALRIQPGIRSICTFSITNVMVLPEIQLSPVFVDEPSGFSRGQIVGQETDIESAGLDQNWSPYYYVDGKIIPYANTADIILCPTTVPQPFRHICDGSALNINGYSAEDIPYKRLYDQIGETFGSSGELLVSANENVVTFMSKAGAREKSAYTPGTTTFTVANTVIGLKYGINLVDNNDLTVDGTFFNEFAPSITIPNIQNFGTPTFIPDSPTGVITYWGSAFNYINPNTIETTTITPGSGSSQATFKLSFTSQTPEDYKTREVFLGNASPYYITSSFLEFATFANNNRQPGGPDTINNSIIFSLDGKYDSPLGLKNSARVQAFTLTNAGGGIAGIIDFKSALTMKQNVKTFVTAIANPFTWTVTVATSPLAGQYFLFSSGTVDFYGWFTVNGVGTDPSIPSRTGVQIEIPSGQTPAQVATIIANTLNDATFNVPSDADLPALVPSSKVSWFINL